MKKRNLLILFVIICSLNLYAKKENKYPVASIPNSLTANAKAVIRFKQHEFEINSDSKATEKITYAITILNENGLHFANFSEYYNKFVRIKNISASVYSANGERMHKIKPEDILDLSATSSGSVYDDNRMKAFDPKTKSFPFTIEYSYEREYRGIFSFPTWHLFEDYNISVEKAVFKVITNDKNAFRIKEKNLTETAKIDKTEDGWIYTWEMENFLAKRYEPFSEHILEYTPVIQLAPNNINIGGNTGSMASWNDFGLFIKHLNENREILPETAKKNILELVEDAKTDEEKVMRIYEYMQNRTRYVSIQVGMGGWQPFEAETVDRLGYGDCKALSNYMKALLNMANIESVYALVMAGENANSLDPNFPANHFNHAFLCVPLKNDTIWLECTSQQMPCGYISDFTDDRKILLIKNNGGEIVHTKTYSAEDNLLTRKAKVILDENGNGLAKVNTQYNGLQYDKLAPLFGMDEKDKKNYVLKQIDIPSFRLISFQHENIKNIIPAINESLELKVLNYASAVGDRLILPLNLMNKMNNVPSFLRKRESEVVVRRSYMYHDTISYKIPENYVIEKTPKTINFSDQFGSYHADVEKRDNELIYTREFTVNKGQYPADNYNEFREFFEKVSEVDEIKCILKKRL